MILDDNYTMQMGWDARFIDKGLKDFENKLKNLDNLNAVTRRKSTGEGSRSLDKDQYQLGRELAAEKTREARKEIAHEQALAIHKRKSEQAEANALRHKGMLLTENRRITLSTRKIEEQIEGLKGIGSPEAKAKVASLEKALKELNNAQISLNKSVRKGDRHFLKYKEQLLNTSDQVKTLNRNTKNITKDFNAQRFAADGLGSSLKNLARSWVSVFAIIGGANYLKKTAQDMENIGVASLLASGSAKKSAKDLKFVSALTKDLGLSYKDTASAYAKFSVAARSSGVSAQKTEEVFTNISNALAGSATNAESAKLAFLGFRQMMSGSVVQAQEINQIVDQMPAFYGAASKALVQMGYDISTVADDGKRSFKETFKVAGVDAKRFVDLSSSIMSEQAKQTGALAKFRQSITAEETRMMNSLQVAVDEMSQAGLEDLFKNIFRGLGNVIDAVKPALVALSTTFGLLAEAVAAPFRWVDKLAMSLGMNEGEGLQLAIRGVFTLLLMKLIPAMVSATKTMFGLVAGGINSAKSLLGMGTAATVTSKQVKGLSLAVQAFKRVLWPLLAIELGLNLFGSVTSKQFEDITEATKTFREEQAALNKELETAQGFYRLGLLTWEKMGIMWDRLVGSIQQAIGYAVQFSKLSFPDVGETLLKGSATNFAGLLDTANSIFGGDSDIKGSVKDWIGESPIQEALKPLELRGQQAANRIVGGATVTNHYNINGDPEVIQTSIREAMDKYVPDYLQTVYSGGG